MRFNPDEYTRLHVMKCDTLQKATAFCEFMGAIGKRWITGESFEQYVAWREPAGVAYYYFNQGTWGWNRPDDGYIVLNFDDFDFSHDPFEPTMVSEGMLSYEDLMRGQIV